MPIRKKSGNEEDVSNFRPIALTSVISKTLERMIATRLTWWLESRKVISDSQAGFRKGRCTTDQCLRLAQRISDGFQASPSQRTLAVLYDFRKAFETVWCYGLLSKLLC